MDPDSRTSLSAWPSWLCFDSHQPLASWLLSLHQSVQQREKSWYFSFRLHIYSRQKTRRSASVDWCSCWLLNRTQRRVLCATSCCYCCFCHPLRTDRKELRGYQLRSVCSSSVVSPSGVNGKLMPRCDAEDNESGYGYGTHLFPIPDCGSKKDGRTDS